MPRPGFPRPTSPGTWGAAVCAVLLLGGCGGPVEVDSPDLPSADRDACRAFLDALPGALADQEPVEVEPDDALGAAYGDPAIVVRCGVGVPDGFSQVSHCEVAEGVGWYVPEEQLDDPEADATLTAVGFSPRPEVTVPDDYRPEGAAAVLAQLAPAVKGTLELVDECD